MHIYTNEERITQLSSLETALEKLITIAEKHAIHCVSQYKSANIQARKLLENGFSQEELSALSRCVPDIIDRHRDWESQVLEQLPNGYWDFPEWFNEVEVVLQPALEAAGLLRQVGYY